MCETVVNIGYITWKPDRILSNIYTFDDYVPLPEGGGIGSFTEISNKMLLGISSF